MTCLRTTSKSACNQISRKATFSTESKCIENIQSAEQKFYNAVKRTKKTHKKKTSKGQKNDKQVWEKSHEDLDRVRRSNGDCAPPVDPLRSTGQFLQRTCNLLYHDPRLYKTTSMPRIAIPGIVYGRRLPNSGNALSHGGGRGSTISATTTSPARHARRSLRPAGAECLRRS